MLVQQESQQGHIYIMIIVIGKGELQKLKLPSGKILKGNEGKLFETSK